MSSRSEALQRTRLLFEQDPRCSIHLAEDQSFANNSAEEQTTVNLGDLERCIYQAGLRVSAAIIFAASICTALVCGYLGQRILSIYFFPLCCVGGAFIPFMFIERKIRARANEFAAEYPTVLLATASSIKAGMSTYAALERSVRLLPKSSLLRAEVEELMLLLSRGTDKDEALRRFGDGIRQADLSLFRTAFSLVLEHGGKFSPTLERLSRVGRDRTILIHSAEVSTATMRFTANILLLVAPLILLMVSARTENYWELFFQHPTANLLASIGLAIILTSYVILLRMSNFKA